VRHPHCLYTIVHVPHERIEPLLLDTFAPIARDIQHHPDIDSLFFVRFSEPVWQLRFRVLGRPAWIGGPLRARLTSVLEELEQSGAIEDHQFAVYDRELERYGGEEGMALAERLFFADSMAALELCDADRRGSLGRSRREVALLLTDRMLDLARFDRRQRIAFYRHGYAWAVDDGHWNDDDRRLLEDRFQKLLPGLDRLFESGSDLSGLGSQEAAAIATRFLDRARPILEAVTDGWRAGRICQELVYLVWSYAHMFTNRMGIESSGEAILRFFMHRYLEERRHVAA